MGFYLRETPDYEEHNEEVRQLLAAFERREHDRAPVLIAGSIRNLLSNPAINSTGHTFEDFFTQPDAQIDCQLAYNYYVRHNLICDREMGLPEEGWQLTLDFQNSYDQAWFGCPFRFFGPTDVPDTEEILKDQPRQLYDWPDPDPFWGRGDFMRRAMEMYDVVSARCTAGCEFHGRPVFPPRAFPGCTTDGVFTTALKLRGAMETMIDMYEAPDYYHDLMAYVTRNTIARIKTHREWSSNRDSGAAGGSEHGGHFSYADDSIAMLSCDQFREFVLPYQKQVFDIFQRGEGCVMHLCGDATHHFSLLAKELEVTAFDTGFPVDHGKLRSELGPDIQINGGPSIMLLKDGTPQQVTDETKKICESGVMDGRRFLLIAANNLAPCTPIENVVAFYEAGRRFGRY